MQALAIRQKPGKERVIWSDSCLTRFCIASQADSTGVAGSQLILGLCGTKFTLLIVQDVLRLCELTLDEVGVGSRGGGHVRHLLRHSCGSADSSHPAANIHFTACWAFCEITFILSIICACWYSSQAQAGSSEPSNSIRILEVSFVRFASPPSLTQ